MRTKKSIEISNWIDKLVENCGDDHALALRLLKTLRAGFYLPSNNVIPEGETRTIMNKLLCSVAGLPPEVTLPDTNLIKIPAPQKKQSQSVEQTPLLPLNLPARSEAIAKETNRILTEKIDAYDANNHASIQPEGTAAHQQMRGYTLNAFASDYYDRSAQSVYKFSKLTPVAFVVSIFSSMATGLLGYKFWQKAGESQPDQKTTTTTNETKQTEITQTLETITNTSLTIAMFTLMLESTLDNSSDNDSSLKNFIRAISGGAVIFAAFAYVLNLVLVFYWSDGRYKQLASKPSIFAEKPLKIDTVLNVMLWTQTLAAAHVSPYLAYTNIKVPILREIATLITIPSPITSNSGILDRLCYRPLSAYAHMILYYSNPEDRVNLMKRMKLESIISDTIDIFRRVDNRTLNIYANKLASIMKVTKKTDLAMSVLLFCAEMRYQQYHHLSWYAKQSFLTKEAIDFSVWFPAFVLGVWGGIYYRATGRTAAIGWYTEANKAWNPNFNATTWQTPQWFNSTFAEAGAYGSMSTNSWYYIVAMLFLVVIFCSVFAERHTPGRFFTAELIITRLLFLIMSIPSTVAAIELAMSNTDPLYEPVVSITALFLMNYQSLVNIYNEMLGRWWCPGKEYRLDPTMSAHQQNHTANRQLFIVKRILGEFRNQIARSDIVLAADLYEFLRQDLERVHGSDLSAEHHLADGAPLATFSDKFQQTQSQSQANRYNLFGSGQIQTLDEMQTSARRASLEEEIENLTHS